MSFDPALDTLFLPFRDGHLQWPQDDALFLRARDGAALHEWKSRLVCEQSFKPDADALQRAGFTMASVDENKHPLILILPPRQRDEARALFARAISSLQPNGRIVASVTNNEGARSHEADLDRLAGPLTTMSKNKCRVFWTAPLDSNNTALANEWRELDAVRPIENGRFMSRPGVFAWDRIDVASALLAKHLPIDLTGRAADLGAGFGFLAAELLSRCPKIVALDLYEAEKRALDLARVNLKSTHISIEFHWHDVAAGLPHKYDVIVMNPPFHTHSANERPDIGRRFVAVAAESLNPGGRLWLVANRHLPYESALNDSFSKVRTVVQQHGFKVIEAIKNKK
ncbi:MAG TPA: class I SAM-dependent methyltransferase [Steroidobacteraceae bacterium]|nr:class I SAM-dependent methyltransferase [Steroidobacteraceae bacterium]